MKINEVAKKVLTEQQYVLIRQRRDAETGEYDVKEYEGKKKGWAVLDMTTASLIDKIYNALTEDRKEKYIRLPLQNLINVSWRLVR